MFIGHFGVGLGAKRIAPTVSLGTLLLAAQFLDLLWPTFLLLGWEHVAIEPGNTKMTPLNFTYYPATHSLLMACAWGVVVGLLYLVIQKSNRGAIVIGICVVSHWILDALVHRPDLPLTFTGTHKVGLGLWNHVPVAVAIETFIFVAGILLYVRSTKALNKVGIFAFWALIAFLVVIQLGNLFGPPPGSVQAIAWGGQLQWLIVVWGFWVDRNRASTTSGK